MNKVRPLLLLCGLLMAYCLAIGQSLSGKVEPARLAIITEDPAAATASDVLTAEFSHNSAIQLFERNEMDRVYREQGLSAANKDYLKLGRLLGANGLLLLSPLKEGTNQLLQARLVAVGPGVIIGSVRSPWPIINEMEWGKWVARHFEPLQPKLTVLAQQAIPISVVNLRAAIRSSEEQELEHQLTILAVERLSRERELFVLERRRMELLSDEKELAGDKQSVFWSGSHLLDGVVDRDGYSKDVVTLNARLLPPKGGTPFTFEVKGSRTNLAEVLDALTRKVREALNLRAPSTPWDPAAEADRYLEEAQWAFKWGMLSEAQSACESAWALGKQTKEVAVLRIRIYGAEGAPVHSDWISSNPASPAYAPDPAKLASAIQALELYQQGFHWFLLNEPRPDTNWYRLGLQLLASELLRQFNYFPEACAGHEEQLATLRLLSRSTADLIEHQPLYTNLSPSIIIARLGTADAYHLPRSGIEVQDFQLVRYGGSYWYETPEDGLAQYRRLADSTYLHTLRILFAYHTITGWTPGAKQRAPALWHGFISELTSSTNALKRLEGYYLGFADATPEHQQERAEKLFNLAVQTAPPLVAGHMEERFVKEIEDLISSPPNGFRNDVNWHVSQSFYSFRTNFAAACEAAVRSFRFEAMKDYLAGQLSTNGPVDPIEFDQLFTRNVRFFLLEPSYEPAEAVALIPPLQRFQQLLKQRQDQDRTGKIHATLQSVEGLLVRLEVVAEAAQKSGPSNIVAQAQSTAPQPRPNAKPTLSRQVSRQLLPLSQCSTNILKATRFWQWPQDLVQGYDLVPNAGLALFRNGRIWVEVVYKSEDVYLAKAFLFGVDPTTFSVEKIELPLVNNQFVFSKTEARDHFETGNSFELLGNSLFFTLGKKIKRNSLSKRTWEDLPVPTAGRLSVLDGRLFSTTDDTIAEISPKGDGQTILASARRRPPATILDSLDHYGQAPIFLGPGGFVSTCISNRVYSLDPKTMAWAEVLSLPSEPISSNKSLETEQGAFCYRATGSTTNRFFIPDDDVSVPMRTAQPPSEADPRSSARQVRLEDPLWPGPDYRQGPTRRMYLPQSKAWVFFNDHMVATNPIGPLKLRGRSDPFPCAESPVIYVLWRELGRPIAVPLELSLRNATFSPELVRHLLYGEFGSGTLPVQPVPTPAGVALLNARIGLWLIPWANLNAGLQAAKEQRIAEQQVRSSTAAQMWTNLVQKYHLTQTDNLGSEQKEAMIDDPGFLELSLDRIDTNHNGKLDGPELLFFDANQNGTLQPSEQAGIEATLSLLAQSLFDEYDLNLDGQMDRTEFQKLVRETSELQPHISGPLNIEQFDLNHDGVLSPVELQFFLKQQMLKSAQPSIYVPPDASSMLVKGAIENYWARMRWGPGQRLSQPFARPQPATAQASETPRKSLEEALLGAVDAGDLQAVRKALDQGANVDVRDDRGWTPLIIAAKAGRLEIARVLVEKGADVNAQSTSKIGSTVLCFATASDQPELLALLVNHGADINAKSKNLVTPLYSAASEDKQQAVRYLVAHGARLSELGFVNERGERFTPLMAAALSGYLDMAKLLLDNGAPLEDKSHLGDTALMLLAKAHHPDILKLLIDRRANVNARGPNGHTALIYAAYNGQIENIKLLLAAGADPNATASDSPGSVRYDAVMMAEQQYHPEAAALVRQAQGHYKSSGGKP